MLDITINQIRETEAFKKMSSARKAIAKNFNNIKTIDHAVKVANNIGFDQWEEKFNPSQINLQIVKELVKSD